MENVIKHHSVIDWDFTAWTEKSLDPAFYISEPSSLKIISIDVPAVSRLVLCRVPSTQNLPQGEVRTWQRGTSISWSRLLLFRNQWPLGDAYLDNGYFWMLAGNLAYLRYRVLGAESTIGSFAISQTIATWERWRAVWWNDYDGEGTPALASDLYKWVASAWVQQGTTLYDTNNRWKDSAINRAGFGCAARSGYLYWWDDTEIWGPIP